MVGSLFGRDSAWGNYIKIVEAQPADNNEVKEWDGNAESEIYEYLYVNEDVRSIDSTKGITDLEDEDTATEDKETNRDDKTR